MRLGLAGLGWAGLASGGEGVPEEGRAEQSQQGFWALKKWRGLESRPAASWTERSHGKREKHFRLQRVAPLLKKLLQESVSSSLVSLQSRIPKSSFLCVFGGDIFTRVLFWVPLVE